MSAIVLFELRPLSSRYAKGRFAFSSVVYDACAPYVIMATFFQEMGSGIAPPGPWESGCATRAPPRWADRPIRADPRRPRLPGDATRGRPEVADAPRQRAAWAGPFGTGWFSIPQPDGG